MANRSRIRVDFNHFPRHSATMRSNAAKATAATAREIEGDAKAQVPVDTGELRDSIQAGQAGGNRWVVAAGAEHAAYVEYGTAQHGGPQPFMTPAAHKAEPGFADKMQNLIPGA